MTVPSSFSLPNECRVLFVKSQGLQVESIDSTRRRSLRCRAFETSHRASDDPWAQAKAKSNSRFARRSEVDHFRLSEACNHACCCCHQCDRAHSWRRANVSQRDQKEVSVPQQRKRSTYLDAVPDTLFSCCISNTVAVGELVTVTVALLTFLDSVVSRRKYTSKSGGRLAQSAATVEISARMMEAWKIFIVVDVVDDVLVVGNVRLGTQLLCLGYWARTWRGSWSRSWSWRMSWSWSNKRFMYSLWSRDDRKMVAPYLILGTPGEHRPGFPVKTAVRAPQSR